MTNGSMAMSPVDAGATSSAICPVCGSRMQGERTLFDDRYGYPGQYRLLTCGECGHRTLDAHLTPNQLEDLYTSYYPRSSFDVDSWVPPREESGWRTWWDGLRASAFRWVPRNVRVLDIGCGFGESLGYHRSRGCEARGVEVDRNILRVAERHGLDVKAGLFDAADYAPASFDVVTLDQVIEHVESPKTLLQGVSRVLGPDGILVVSTPNVDGWGARLFGRRWIHWHVPYHLQFFTHGSMLKLAEQTGFQLQSTKTVTPSAWLHFQWGHVLTYPHAGTPSPYWSTSLPRSMLQRIGLKLLHVADKIGLNAAATRFMDMLGFGDNVVYVLRKSR
jgi:2-polyprenyl-3-methyl-5-hydroxy-6-metoxy-1,4-benzoquinol methylase